MSKTVGVISLGCPKNLVDTEIMLGLLEEAGYKIVTDPAKSDIIIINTCSFIEDAKRESIETIIEMGHAKTSGRAQHLVVTGCFTQRYKDELLELFPEVDLFVGTGEYHQIVKLLRGINLAEEPGLYVGIPEYIHTHKTPRKVSTASHAVYVKIAEGCFHGCSFCAIPKIRGKFRSRTENDIVKEAAALIQNGAKEINLIAQDTTAYGRDLKNTNIVSLVEKIAGISGEKWIRLLYTYPQSFRKGMIALMKHSRDLCRYVDMPIQHIDDKVLEKMRRGKSENKIRSVVEYIKTELPDISLRTSIIVGFPGETERQFKKLLKYVEEGWFDHVGVFKYSEEEGTLAAKMKGHIEEKVKLARQKEIMKAQKKISKKKMKARLGQTIKVLVEGVSLETDLLLQARAEFQAPDIDGVVYINDGKALKGNFYNVEITETYDYDLIAKVV